MSPSNARDYLALRVSLRVLFGFVLLIDGAMKFVYMTPSDVVRLVQGAGQSQPDWLAGWFSFWSNVVSANPALMLYTVGTLELLLGVAWILALRKRSLTSEVSY